MGLHGAPQTLLPIPFPAPGSATLAAFLFLKLSEPTQASWPLHVPFLPPEVPFLPSPRGCDSDAFSPSLPLEWARWFLVIPTFLPCSFVSHCSLLQKYLLSA